MYAVDCSGPFRGVRREKEVDGWMGLWKEQEKKGLRAPDRMQLHCDLLAVERRMERDVEIERSCLCRRHSKGFVMDGYGAGFILTDLGFLDGSGALLGF